MAFSFTCTGASVGQVRRDSDCSALIDTHALQTFVNSSDEATLTYQADFRGSSLVAVKETKRFTKNMTEVCQTRSEDLNSGISRTDDAEHACRDLTDYCKLFFSDMQIIIISSYPHFS